MKSKEDKHGISFVFVRLFLRSINMQELKLQSMYPKWKLRSINDIPQSC